MMIRDWLQTWRRKAARNRDVLSNANRDQTRRGWLPHGPSRFAFEGSRSAGACEMSRRIAQGMFLRRSRLGARTRLS